MSGLDAGKESVAREEGVVSRMESWSLPTGGSVSTGCE